MTTQSPDKTQNQTDNRREFQAEVKQVLELVIHSLYSNRDIFLRELISNASDAIDKFKFQSLTNRDLVKEDVESQIIISADEEKKILVIEDNGIGMNEADLINNLGTIAKSGTKEFVEALRADKEGLDLNKRPEMIGKFGVGFYSSFMVAKNVTVITRKAGEDKTYRWTSDGAGSYAIEEIPSPNNRSDETDEATESGAATGDWTGDSVRFAQGTKIILNMRDDAEEYLKEYKIRSIVKKYSDFIEHPIKLIQNLHTGHPHLASGEAFVNEEPELTQSSMRIPNEQITKHQDKCVSPVYETLNSRKALWTRTKNEITEEDYKDFYKHISHDFEDPLTHIHYAAEGTNEFKALLYIPKKAPFDLFLPQQDSKKGLQLYINKVFITSDLELLLPQYLRFVKGVIDASDLPLNVSRELLQSNPKVAAIKKNITKKILSEIEQLKKDDIGKYTEFYKEFGKVLKEGVHLDFANKDKILDLLLFETSKTETSKLTSLQQYIDRMEANTSENAKKEIYFITGESRKELENSPYLEAFKARNIEVIFMVDPVDEWVTMSAFEYKGKQFKSISRGEVDLGEPATASPSSSESDKDAGEQKNKKEKYKDIPGKIKNILGKIKDVKFSDRLVDTLCCLVVEEGSISANLERLYKSANQAVPEAQRILELNPNHAVIEKLSNILTENPNDPRIADYAEIIYNQALLMEGSKVEDPVRFSRLVAGLMA